MGRHRRRVDTQPYQGSLEDREVVEERLGLTKLICASCNARNPEDADKCRKCGHTKLRQKNSEYQDA